MDNYSALQNKIDAYLAHRINLRDLEAWLMPQILEFVNLPDKKLSSLALLLEEMMFEFGEELITDETIQRRLSTYRKDEPRWFRDDATSPTIAHSAPSQSIEVLLEDQAA